jgi:hypothetical protein
MNAAGYEIIAIETYCWVDGHCETRDPLGNARRADRRE